LILNVLENIFDLLAGLQKVNIFISKLEERNLAGNQDEM